MAGNSMPDDTIYESSFVKDLFDEMATTYGMTNLVSSFGFTLRWRRQCVEQVRIRPGDHVLDLMSGQGELWPYIKKSAGAPCTVTAIDFSSTMCRAAAKKAPRYSSLGLTVKEEDVFRHSVLEGSADVVVSSFGLKTFTLEQQVELLARIRRLLKLGGQFSLLEISVPNSKLLRGPYLWYLNRCIPSIGKLCLGNPDNYRLLGEYTGKFGNCHPLYPACEKLGLQATVTELFAGCATVLHGTRAT